MPRLFLAALAALALAQATRTAQAEPQHAIAMHGSPKEAADFHHFSYVNPDAPKGGRLTLAAPGSFDSLNPMIVRGEPAQGIRDFVVESLMARGQDEAFTLYGLIAETVDVPADRSWVAFRLNPKAQFSDGTPVTADDVLFSFELLKEKARPNYRTYYKKVAKAERVSEREVRFTFAGGGDREMPLILGLMPVLPRHAVDPDTFESTSLVPPVGSGPYRIGALDAGRSITYERNPDYWGRDLPVNRGRFNFQSIRFEYFRDGSTLFEAFKAGHIDLRSEDDPAHWAEGYSFQGVADGRVIKEEIATGLPAGMTALVFNTRRAQFAEPRVREALMQLFNGEWVNKNLYHGLYKRSESFFERSYLSSAGNPADERERALLAPFADRVAPEILDGTYHLPQGNASGHNRADARRAYELLEAAGFALRSGKLVDQRTGLPLEFEVLAGNSGPERLLANYKGDLERLGIVARIRIVDSAQYQARLKDYDFDMIQFTWPASLSPGNEQLFRWSSQVADQPGSYNYAGVKNPAADAMIAALLAAESPEAFTSAVRALDRVLRSGHYVIPLFHVPKQWVAYWRRLRHPETVPITGFNLDSWWVEDTK